MRIRHCLSILSLLLTTLAIGGSVAPAAAAELTGAQRQAEQEVARIGEISQRHFRQQKYVDETSADAFAVRALEAAYGPLHPRVIEYLAKLLDKHGAHGVHRYSVALGNMMLDKLDALPGVPADALPGYHALVTYFRWAADSFSEPARPFLKRALSFLSARLGADHPDVTTLREYLFGSRLAGKPFDQAFDELGRFFADARWPRNDLFADLHGVAPADRSQAVYTRTIDHFSEVLGDDHNVIAYLLSLQASDLMAQAKPVEAMPMAARAVAIIEKRRIANPAVFAQALLTLSAASASVGGIDQAEQLSQRALRVLAPYTGETWHRHLTYYAAAYNSLAVLAQGRREEALQVADAVIAGSTGDDNPVARSSLRLARIMRASALLESKRYGEAIEAMLTESAMKPAGNIERAANERFAPYRHLMLAKAQIGAGRVDEALRSMALAAPRLRMDNDVDQSALLSVKASIAAMTDQKPAAILLGKMAVNRLQNLRRNVRQLDLGFDRGFMLNNAETYQFVADLLIEAGRLPEAQQVLVMLKEDEFAEYTSRGLGAGASDPVAFSGQEARWEQRYRSINGQIAAMAGELEALRTKSGQGKPLSTEESARKETLDNDLKAARAGFDKYLAELTREFAQGEAERGIELGEKNLGAVRALQGTLKRLGQGAVLLHYLVTDRKLRILLTTPSVQIARETSIDARNLARKVNAFRQATTGASYDPKPIAGELHRLLIAPVQADLDQAGAETLMVSLDGVLRYLPIAALYDGERYVVERYRVAIYNEAARDKLKDAPTAAWRFAGLGLTHAVPGFDALPSVRKELEGIVKGGVLPGEIYLDDAFDAVRLRTALDQGFPVVHVASHFVFQPGTDVNSYLMLGDGSRLTLRDIKESNLSFNDVDLFTLSACDTANFGGRDANGREVEGLGTLLQKQGARSVMATLWPVNDESTGVFMQQLYRLRQTGKLSKAEALRQTQLAFVKSSINSGGKQQDFSHPFYWAPFILMGNWL